MAQAGGVVVLHRARKGVGGPGVEAGAMLGPSCVPPRAALGDLVVERDVGAPGQGVARPARRLRVPGCLPLADRRRGAIALGALERLGHRLDLRDLGKPRLRRRPPVGRQAGRQVGGGGLGRPLGAEGVVVGVGIATPGLQGVLQAVEALRWGDRLAQVGLGPLPRCALPLEVGPRGPNVVSRPAQLGQQRLREDDRVGHGIRPRQPRCDRRHLRKDAIALQPPFWQVGERGLRPRQQRLAIAEHGGVEGCEVQRHLLAGRIAVEGRKAGGCSLGLGRLARERRLGGAALSRRPSPRGRRRSPEGRGRRERSAALH